LRIYRSGVAQHYRIVVKFVYVIVLHVFVIKGVNKPDKNTGKEFEIEKKMRNKRFKIFELKNAEPVDEKIE
jgi:hypothetical protein